MNRLLTILIIFISLNQQIQATEQSVVLDWEISPIREDLYLRRTFEIEQKQDFQQLNQDLLKSIQSYEPTTSIGRINGINAQQGQMLISKVMNHDMLSDSKRNYDPEGQLGFCFGRALKLHLELLRYGVNKDSIKKIFVIGPMNLPGKVWQFHVATIVKDLNSNDWWALDTNLRKPVMVADWMKYYEKYRSDRTERLFRKPKIDPTKSLRFYITQPEKIGASGWEYNIKSGGLFDDYYNEYFKDMFKLFKQHPVPVSEKFNFNQCRKLF